MSDITGETRYTEKSKRIMDAVELRPTDRVPTSFFATFWLAKYGGVSCRDLFYDYNTSCNLMRKAVIELDPDSYISPFLTMLGPSLDATGYKQLQWPGHGVSDNHSFQFLDKEYMTADEYDDFIFDPTGFYLNKYMPRVAEAYEGFAHFPVLPGNMYVTIASGPLVAQLANPEIARSFEAIQKAAQEAQSLMMKCMTFGQEMTAQGYPESFGAVAPAPLDFFGDYFRGAKGILTDIRRRPEKLIEAMEKVLVFLLRGAIGAARMTGNKFVFIPIHWGPDGFMSVQQFKTLWWPTFQRLLLGLIENDLIPVVLWEANCTSRLEIIGDIPAGKAVYWFEHTDLVKAKEVLGKTVCLRGNVPASLLTTGTPEQVDAECRRLIEKVGKDGGFILDGSIGIPDEAPVENVRAMFQSVHKYSV
ncbi:MAG: uroporphyrinogen decarboxylase family protein [Desulfuromonadaceae bacterium]|nr:uroporphyrinogen decarboxylase family protein [Desulfuromonadaceae bacterium]